MTLLLEPDRCPNCDSGDTRVWQVIVEGWLVVCDTCNHQWTLKDLP